MQNLVQLINVDDGQPLRNPRRGETHFKMTLPSKGSVVRYYSFNQDDYYKGQYHEYKVNDVVQDLQESWNGVYEERFTVFVERLN